MEDSFKRLKDEPPRRRPDRNRRIGNATAFAGQTSAPAPPRECFTGFR